MNDRRIVDAPPLLGAHFSIAKGLHNALYEARAHGCNTLQIFTKNATTWKERTLRPNEIHQFEQVRAETGIATIASHASYLINLATVDKIKHAMSCRALKHELVRSAMLDIPYVVLHPGSHMGSGETAGIRRIAESINRIFAKLSDLKIHLLLETTAGQGSSVGQTFEQLAAIVDQVEKKEAMGFCLDTSHIFAAGYDIRTRSAYQKTMAAFDRIAGIKHLHLIHLNDSQKELGSKVDRHEHIGRGTLGLKPFELIMNDARLIDIPKIIETPKQHEEQHYDPVNFAMLRALILNQSYG